MTATRNHDLPQAKPQPKTLVISDFDGTVSTVDIGNRVFNRFTGDRWNDIDRRYVLGTVGSKEAYLAGAPFFSGDRAEVLAYCLETGKIDPSFSDFYRFCRVNNFDLIIASDGLDFYIEAFLAAHGLSGIAFFSNRAVFENGGKLSVSFPYASEACGKCGTCKKAILENRRPAYDRIIYVGDGTSDVCPSKKADLVFAKRVLYEKCVEDETPCIRFENFRDVQLYLSDHKK
ncbi:MAG: MtnX-like HAD-IB family phosphatase [Deltaproteobacteria bacterium]|nr:MtnX-like HAD-IB family phosphatase [Deltaproteobacteria bacterium]